MKRGVVGLAVVGLAGLVGSTALAAAPTAYPRPGHTERVSVSSTGVQATYPTTVNDSFAGGDFTPDGRFVAFASGADNLVPGDTNGINDVFVRDTVRGTTVRVSVSSTGAQALPAPNQGCPTLLCLLGSVEPKISADGRYVVFTSDALNLVPGDTNLYADIFVHDLRTHTTSRLSVSSAGVQSNGGSLSPSITADGRQVAFLSSASNLVVGDTNGAYDVFVRDVPGHRTTRVSVAPDGSQAQAPAMTNLNSQWPSISANGRVVVFGSNATNLLPGEGADAAEVCGRFDVYAHDMRTGKNTRVSVASDGSRASFALFPSCLFGGSTPRPQGAVSEDGRWVTFESSATNLVPNDSNFSLENGYGSDVFVHDLASGRTERVSVTSNGHDKTDPSLRAIMLSSRYVAYTTDPTSCAGTLAAVPDPGVVDLHALCGGALESFGVSAILPHTRAYLYDRFTGAMELLAVNRAGTSPKPGSCTNLNKATGQTLDLDLPEAVTRDGRRVLLASCGQDVVSGDTNNHWDMFVRDRGPALGTGSLLSSSPAPAPGPSPTCVIDPVCPPAATEGAAELERASVAHRSGLSDLYIRWDLAHLAAVGGAPADGLLYELRFTSGGQHYAVRAQRIPGPDFDAAGGASFGLFRETSAGVWERVAALKGGYGTIGDSVVTAVPLSLLGGQLTDVTAFTAVGSYLSGPTKVLDSLRLSR